MDFRRRPFIKADEKPRSDQVSWLDVAKVVYTWTDRRETDIDRKWWNTAGIRSYMPAVQRPVVVKGAPLFDFSLFTAFPAPVADAVPELEFELDESGTYSSF